jgi:prolyl oligopeptidase
MAHSDLPIPPDTAVRPVDETFHGTTISDPYRWLEDVDSQETKDWIGAQNGHTRNILDNLPGRRQIKSRLDVLLTGGSVGTPRIRDARYFYARRDGRQDQPVLLVRDGLDGADRTLLDPNQLSQKGVVALDWWFPSNDGKLLAYGLSEGGDEMSTLRVMDVATGENLSGEVIPRTRAAAVAWLPDASGFYYTRYPEAGTVPAGEEFYNRHIFFHRLGTSPDQDDRVFGEGRAREDWPEVAISESGRWLFVLVSQGWAKSEIFLYDLALPGADWVPLHTGVQAWADFDLGGDRIFLRTNEGAPNYQLFEVDPRQPRREHWRLVLPERADKVLTSASALAGHLVTEELENASSRLRIYDTGGSFQREVELPALGSLTGIGGEWDGPQLSFGFTSFAQPSTAYLMSSLTAEPSVFAQGELPAGLDPSVYRVEQVWYASKDGTKVSMFVIRHQDTPVDGQRPTLLTGYGGFNVSRTPVFISALPLWLDAGGVYALPNLRGGGEYGESWHQSGMLGNKQNVFDDFAAAGEWLIANGYTTADRLAISGGSNGGLLVGAALTQRPDLFKAVVCQVPLLDMLRYQHLRIARLWIPEYGSSEDPEQFQWLHAYSPYHHVTKGERYPATLLMTAEGDSRVDPMHALKMAALLQRDSAGGPVLLRVESEAGHGAGKPRSKVLDEATDVWSFVHWQLGVEPAEG